MGELNYIYAPESPLTEQFRCRVPMKGTRQLFLVNGGVQGTAAPLNISLGEGQVMEDILQVISVRTEGAPLEISYRNTLHFGKGSQARILLCSHTFTLDKFKTEEDVDITLEDDAVVDMVVMQNEHNEAVHNSRFNIKVGAGASIKVSFLTLHGGSIENKIQVNIDGEKGNVDLSGLYLVDGNQFVSNVVEMRHNVADCTSSQLFKGVLDNESSARFSGIIYVKQDAQRIDAYQANHNLLLSDKARIHTEPQLEIYADDVKCSHGATIGRLDENELFYLRSRGIPMKEAKILQQMAFAYSVLEKISNSELRERMENLVEKRLRGEFSNCKECSKNCC